MGVPSSAKGVCISVLSSPLATGVWGCVPARYAFWRILKATERSFLYLYADALSSSNSILCHIWGQGPRFGAIVTLLQCRTASVVTTVNVTLCTHFWCDSITVTDADKDVDVDDDDNVSSVPVYIFIVY